MNRNSNTAINKVIEQSDNSYLQSMEDLPMTRVPAGRSNTAANRCITFENQIEKVELRRQYLVEELLRNKRQLKQNCKFYLHKKQIIPSAFDHSSCHQPSSMKIFNTRLQKRRNQIYSEHHKNDEVSSQAENEKQDMVEKEIFKDVVNECRVKQKWKIEMNSEELNCLFFGKQLKIGLINRQKYISDDKIQEMKRNILRSKSKQSSICQSKKELETSKFKQVEFMRRKKNAIKSGVIFMKNILHLNSLKKVMKYQPVKCSLLNQKSEPIRERQNPRKYLAEISNEFQ